MTRRVLVVAETDPADGDHGKLFGLDPNQATGVAIPAFRSVSAVPAAGTTPGEAVYDNAHQQGFVWDGTAWKPIAPNPIKLFNTEAALLADTAAAVGNYATAGDTGNLFVRRAAGWAQVGIKQYATAALLLADSPVQGCVGEALDEGSLWEMSAPGPGGLGNWRCLNIRELADTAAVVAWANTGNAVGSGGCNIGDEAIDVLHDISYIRGSSGWRPDSIWEDTEANIRAATWVLNGQEAIATDTGKSFVRVAGKWEEAPIQHFPTEAGLLAATPRDGVMAWSDDTSRVFARAGGRWVGMNTGFSDPTPIGTIAAFPTATMPAGWLLCDGGTIPAGTDFDALRALLATTTVPDLRGQFLRGASTATDALLQRIRWSTGKPAVDFTTTASLSGVGISVPSTGLTVSGTVASNGAHTHATDSQGAHTHTWGQSSRQSKGGGDYLIVDGWNDVRTTSEAGAHTHTAQSAGAHTHSFTGTVGGTAVGSASGTVTGTVNGGGDSETAPDHIKIHWGIKARFASVLPATALLVNTTTPVDGEQLVFDAASGSWMNKPSAPPTVVAAAAPTAPRLGQQWFDTSVNTLKVCTAVTPAVIWTATSPPMTVGTAAPTSPQLGQEWFDTTAKALKVCTAVTPSVVWQLAGGEADLKSGTVTIPAGAGTWFEVAHGFTNRVGLYRVEIEPGDNNGGGIVVFELQTYYNNSSRIRLIEAQSTAGDSQANIDTVGFDWADGDSAHHAMVRTSTLASQAGRLLRVTVRAMDASDLSAVTIGGPRTTTPGLTVAVPALYPPAPVVLPASVATPPGSDSANSSGAVTSFTYRPVTPGSHHRWSCVVGPANLYPIVYMTSAAPANTNKHIVREGILIQTDGTFDLYHDETPASTSGSGGSRWETALHWPDSNNMIKANTHLYVDINWLDSAKLDAQILEYTMKYQRPDGKRAVVSARVFLYDASAHPITGYALNSYVDAPFAEVRNW